MPRGRAAYDDDDYDDGYYDDDGDDYDEYDDTPEQKPQKVQQAVKPGQKKQPVAQAAAAGASRLAQCLCDPPPLRPDGKLQKGASKTIKAKAAAPAPPTYPVAPPSTSGSHTAYDFSDPSPDDNVMAARRSGVPAARTGGGVAVSIPTVKAPASSSAQRPSAPPPASSSTSAGASGGGGSGGAGAGGAANAAAAVGGLSLRDSDTAGVGPQSTAGAGRGGKAGSSKGGKQGGVKAANLADYVMEADLAREVLALVAREAASSAPGGAPGSGPTLPLHLVVLGHVDAGKSTLMGRLLHDLGHVSDKEAHKNLKEATQMGKSSFSWAWVLDERSEERARGVTVDVAMARFSTPRYNVTLLDAPGHRDFVPNMIGGAAQADAALLLVDGSVGGFEAGFQDVSGGGGGGQTKEHAQLARSLGVEQVAVVISKLDTCDYSQDRFTAIQSQLLPFLKSCGWRESALQWLPAVGPQGENLTAPPKDPRLASWWRGPTLVQAIDTFHPKERNTGRPLRIPVADVMRGKSSTSSAGGKVVGGAIKVGGRVLVVPPGEVAVVKSLEVDGKSCQVAFAGDSVDVALTGIDAANLSSGAVICHPDFPVPLVTKFQARVLVLDVPMPVLKGQSVTVHAHTAREAGHISGLLSVLNPKTGEVSKSKPRCLTKGQAAIVEVTVSRSLCLQEYGDYKALGRVALRDGGRTLAVGVVTQVGE